MFFVACDIWGVGWIFFFYNIHKQKTFRHSFTLGQNVVSSHL